MQFPAGLFELVEQVVQGAFAEVRVSYSDDSAVVLDTRSKIQTADDTPFAKNVFAIRAETKRRGLGPSISALAGALRPLPGSRSAGFRLMYHVDGQLVAAEPGPRRQLEQALGRATGLRLTPRGQCLEFWVIARRDSPMVYLAERLPARSTPPHPKGALSAEISALLVMASKPQPEDIFLDPFAGSGALLRARLRTPAHTLIYNDLELDHHRASFKPPLGRKVQLLGEDALRLPSLKTGSIDAIVTDPPWGEHQDTIGDYPAFATEMAKSLKRVLKPRSGRLILLINRRNEDTLAQALKAHEIRVHNTYRLLVNGHPASAIRAQT